MSSYIKADRPLEYDNAPDWLIAFMRYRVTVLANTKTSVMTFFGALREYCQWLWQVTQTGTQPVTEAQLRSIDILEMPLEPVIEAKKKDIESYLYFLADVLQNDPSTRNKKLVAVSTLYDYLLDQQESLGVAIDGNPTDRIRRPKQSKKEPVYLSETEQRDFLAAISGENAIRDYALFLLMLSTGVRISEVVGINLADLNLKSQTCRIRGKGNKERIVPLTLPCCKALQNYIQEYREIILGVDTNALFISKRQKNRLTSRMVEKAMQKYVLAAGLGGSGFTPHKLRHTAATTLAKSGAGVLEIQQLLGHESTATTEIYTHLGKEDVAKVVNNSSLASLGSIL